MKVRLLLSASILLISLSACVDSSGSGALMPGTLPTHSSGVISPGSGSSTPAPTSVPRVYSTDALVFDGDGTWSSEVSSIESILDSHGATYKAVNSSELNSMSVDDMTGYGILIFPGGSGGTEAGSLTSQTHANLRAAVQERGVSYIGFCAGSFIAVAPAPPSGGDVSYGIGVVAGPELNYYYLENQGTDIAMTLLSFADGTNADILWYGGPVTPNTGVIAKYPDGTPAISEMWSGNGFVVLSGVHPTATQAILSSVGMTSTDGVHLDIAWDLIDGALHQQPLKSF